MIIRAIKLRAITDDGEYGFQYPFSRNLTIIRGSNSSGKSTLFNSMLYALGMEEIIGGKGEKTLPYSVKDYFEFDQKRINVAASETLIEIENSRGDVVTLRRAIKDKSRDVKLIEIFQCAHITKNEELGTGTPTYLHDPGGAKRQEGFHRFIETFFSLNLPNVATTNGGETKLYPQAVFAALAIEQKRGWTDYIANIPFYGIRDARTRVAEYLLGLSVFETSSKLNKLNSESIEIDAEWKKVASEIRRESSLRGVMVEGVPLQPSPLFEASTVTFKKNGGAETTTLEEYLIRLRAEYKALREKVESAEREAGSKAVKEIDNITEEIQRLSLLHDRITASLNLQRSSLKEYEGLLREAKEDLERNKTAAKLRDLGAQSGLSLASGNCPTCHQPVEDTLLYEAVSGPQMDLATNINYLDSQRRMLDRQIISLRDGISKSEITASEFSKKLAEKIDQLNAMRGDINSGANAAKAVVRRQVQIEIEVENLEKLTAITAPLLVQLTEVARRMARNQLARKELPKESYTEEDEAKISMFQKQFRANAGSFGYESAPIEEIEISRTTLVPGLSQLELREIRTDIKSDSSASDFVRLIWSYLIALYQTSSHPNFPGNHPKLLLLDEPGQHSMAVDSQHALLIQLAGERGLQSIVAASFDESETVFQQATSNVSYKLIEWDGKLIRPLQS